MDTIQPDVLIVGAGPAGAALALNLKKKGKKVLVVERTPEAQDLFKGEYIQPAAVATMEKAGLESVLTERSARPITSLRFRELAEDDRSLMSEVVMPYEKGKSARSISHFDLQTGLRSVLRTQLGDAFMEGVTLRPLNHEDWKWVDHPVFTVTHAGKTMKVRPRWVVGCDGRHSSVRAWIGGPRAPRNTSATLGSGLEFIIGAEVPTPAPNPTQYEVIRTWSGGTLASFALGGDKQRLYWNVEDTGSQQNARQAWGQQLKRTFDRASFVGNFGTFGDFDGNRIAGAPAGAAWLLPNLRGKVLLASDAVAITTPFGGQGITCAMEHVEYLSNRFNFDARSEKDLKTERESYTRAIASTFERINVLNFGVYYLFYARSRSFKIMNRHVLSSWKKNPEATARVMRLFAGTDTDAPSIPELLRLWGISDLGSFWRLARSTQAGLWSKPLVPRAAGLSSIAKSFLKS